MNKTKIEWVKNPDGSQGYTWNPITGCLNGCEYCYARKLANGRLRERYLDNGNVAPNRMADRSWNDGWTDPFYPRLWLERISEMKPLFHCKEKGVFVCDMSDLFGIGIPDDWISQVLFAIKVNPWHRFYLLTKQPQNLAKFSPFPDNCWVGVSATNTKMFHNACYYLADIKASVKYLSVEPFLEWEDDGYQQRRLEEAGISGVIVGSQTKPYKPPKREWVDEILAGASKANIPVFLKNNLVPMLNEYNEKKFPHSPDLWDMKGLIKQEMPTIH